MGIPAGPGGSFRRRGHCLARIATATMATKTSTPNRRVDMSTGTEKAVMVGARMRTCATRLSPYMLTHCCQGCSMVYPGNMRGHNRIRCPPSGRCNRSPCLESVLVRVALRNQSLQSSRLMHGWYAVCSVAPVHKPAQTRSERGLLRRPIQGGLDECSTKTSSPRGRHLRTLLRVMRAHRMMARSPV